MLRTIACYAEDRVSELIKGGFTRRFHGETTCVTDAIQTYCARHRMFIGNVSELLIYFTDERNTMTSAEHILLRRSAYRVRRTFPFRTYVEASEDDHKKALVFHEIVAALHFVARQEGGSTADIEALSCHLLKDNVIHTSGFVQRPPQWRSPNNKWAAKIFFSHDVKWITLSVVLVDTLGVEHDRRQLVKYPAHGPSVRDLIGRGRWANDFTFELSSKSLHWKSVWSCEFPGLRVNNC